MPAAAQDLQDLLLTPVADPGEEAANDSGAPVRTTLWELIGALQEAADELSDTQAQADRLVTLAMLDIHEVTCPEQAFEDDDTRAA